MDSDDSKSILIVDVSEIEEKPCITYDRVFIRSGSSVRVADSNEIRKMVFNKK